MAFEERDFSAEEMRLTQDAIIEQSAVYLERWLAVEPRWEIARDLGFALEAAGDRDGAVRAWRRALALLPAGHPERASHRPLQRVPDTPRTVATARCGCCYNRCLRWMSTNLLRQ